MITFKELRWTNAFSYSGTNVIKLDEDALTQIIGKNGHGKSSIALVLEEVLFNTNSKKIKKADVLNRYVKDKSYAIDLDFDKDGIAYHIHTTRSATTGSVKLTANGTDISSHTATGTYKSIENILGYDHKTFSQIVYQGSVSSLEFLTATDTARKKFLIELLNLSVYTSACDVFKKLASDSSKTVDTTQAKVTTINNWLVKYGKESLETKELVIEPENPTELQSTLSGLKVKLSNLEATNKAITQNNTYKSVLDNLEVAVWNKPVPSQEYRNELAVELASLKKELVALQSMGKKCTAAHMDCPTCGQVVDQTNAFTMAQAAKSKEPGVLGKIELVVKELALVDSDIKDYSVFQARLLEWEKYSSLYDKSKTSVMEDRSDIETSISRTESDISVIVQAIAKARSHNKAASEHNARVEVIAKQLEEMRADLAVQVALASEATSELSNLEVLVKAFSTTGLVAYKIECLVKDLEEITNTYLADLADGRFQLSFVINSSDKLNVVITDNGRDISIEALSGGERARVNVATLLGIRKLMQTLSNSRTNLLFLDETVDALDAEGKEKLVEVLLAEESLNTFIISHGFNHPLLEKLHIVKENNVSRIE